MAYFYLHYEFILHQKQNSASLLSHVFINQLMESRSKTDDNNYPIIFLVMHTCRLSLLLLLVCSLRGQNWVFLITHIPKRAVTLNSNFAIWSTKCFQHCSSRVELLILRKESDRSFVCLFVCLIVVCLFSLKSIFLKYRFLVTLGD